MPPKPRKGSLFFEESLVCRDLSEEEEYLFSESREFLCAFMGQLKNWFLNHLKAQLFGSGGKVFYILQSEEVGWGVTFEAIVDPPAGESYVVVRVDLPGEERAESVFALKDLKSARHVGQWVMEEIGECKRYRKRHRTGSV